MESKLGIDICRLIVMFLDDKSLCRWTRTCKKLQQLDQDITDSTWKFLCEKRWHRCHHLLRLTGTSSYKIAYHILSFRKIPPRGKFTDKRNHIFGYHSMNGVCGWVYLDHSSDCKPRSKIIDNVEWRVVTIRLCIQNIGHDVICIMTSDHSHYDLSIVKKARHLKENHQHQHDHLFLTYFHKTILTFNGQSVNQLFSQYNRDEICLSYLDNMVLSMDVQCNDDIINEVDFLCSIDSVRIHYETKKSSNDNDFISMPEQLICNIIDEDDVWEYYTPIPPGLVVLKEYSDIRSEARLTL